MERHAGAGANPFVIAGFAASAAAGGLIRHLQRTARRNPCFAAVSLFEASAVRA